MLKGDKARAAMARGISAVAESIRGTLGPDAFTVLYKAPSGRPFVVNDGVSVVRQIKPEDPFEELGATLMREVAEEAQKARAHFVQQEYARLVQALPEWKDKNSTVKKDVQEYAKSVGFLPEEINQLADHRSVLVIKKAMEYDKLTTKVAPKKKAVKKVPKVQKSGRGNSKEDSAAEAIKKKRARLQKSGKQDDAASIFYDML